VPPTGDTQARNDSWEAVLDGFHPLGYHHAPLAEVARPARCSRPGNVYTSTNLRLAESSADVCNPGGGCQRDWVAQSKTDSFGASDVGAAVTERAV